MLVNVLGGFGDELEEFSYLELSNVSDDNVYN